MARKGSASSDSTIGPWTISRAHAYTVVPQRTTDIEVTPRGGILRLDDEIKSILARVLTEIDQRHFTPIDLEVDGTSRTSPVRDQLLEYVFGAGGQIAKAAIGLALRLAAAMDRRSTPSLLLTVLERHLDDDARRRMTLLLFPQEQAFHFESSGEVAREAVIRVLDNIFSTGSKLRKVARFDGKNIKSHFLSGEIVDYQAGTTTRSAADFWIERFLFAKFRLNSEKGMQLLAQGLRAAVAAATVDEKDQAVTALMYAVSNPRTRWSLDEFAREQLPPSARDAFLRVAPNEETRRASFDVNKSSLREKLNYRIFQLENGIYVSSPLEQVGRAITIEDSKGRRILSCSGVVVDEKVSSRKA